MNQRELTSHVEFEPNTYYAAFSAELEAPATAMWALAIHLRDASSIHLTKKLLKHCLSALDEWFEAINFNRPEQVLHQLPPVAQVIIIVIIQYHCLFQSRRRIHTK